MANYTIHQAKTHLSRLIQAVLRGEEVVISKGNQPLVKLVALETRAPRRLDGAAGLVELREGFDAPLEDFEEYTK